MLYEKTRIFLKTAINDIIIINMNQEQPQNPIVDNVDPWGEAPQREQQANTSVSNNTSVNRESANTRFPEINFSNIDWAVGNLECIMMSTSQNTGAFIYNLKQELLSIRSHILAWKTDNGQSLQQRIENFEASLGEKDKVINELRFKIEQTDMDMKRINDESIDAMAHHFQIECELIEKDDTINKLRMEIKQLVQKNKHTVNLLEELQGMINNRIILESPSSPDPK